MTRRLSSILRKATRGLELAGIKNPMAVIREAERAGTKAGKVRR